MAFSLLSRLSSKARQSVGLDIGSYAVKMVAVSGLPGKFTLADSAISVLERDPQSPVPQPTMSKSIADLLGRSGLNLSDLRLSVSGKGVIVREVEMPRMSPEELRSSIKYEAELLLPFSLDDCIFDCHILDPGSEDRVKMKVLLAAARRSVVQNRLELLTDTGISPKVVSIDAIALVNAFWATGRECSPDETISLVNVGAARSTLNIVSGMNLDLTRDIEVGGDRATISIARGMGLDPKEAEKRKRDANPSMKEFVTPMIVALVRELRSTFDYVSSKLNRQVKEIYLSGGSSLLGGLKETLASEFGIEVAHWDPLQGMLLPERGVMHDAGGCEPMLAVAAGLAVS